jgi:type I restriction enzyme S subunit
MRSGQPGINGTEYATVPLRLPPMLEEQRAIAAILHDTDLEIAGLEERLTKAKNLKRGMAQELLTGRIRLV